jgi:3-methyladenine DNA glycosylase AlkD
VHPPAPFLHDLEKGLEAHVVASTRAWWESYLKGTAAFRGVKMADVRGVVRRLWADHGLERWPVADVVDLALACCARHHTEDKLAGMLLFGEQLGDQLGGVPIAALERPLAAGHLADWNSCDWYCVKVLGPRVERADDPGAAAAAIAGWRDAPGLWQRRAAAVAFVNLAPRGDGFLTGFVELLLEVCAANVQDSTRWSQTSVGWLLRELSRPEPDRVRAFVAAHPELSPEARRNALSRLGK